MTSKQATTRGMSTAGDVTGSKADLEQKLENTPVGGSAADIKAHLNVIEIVKFEHAAVKQLHMDYKAATDVDTKSAKAHLICNQITQHSGKEEIALYPFLKTHLPNGEQEMEKAKQEHQLVTEDLYKLDQMKLDPKNAREFDALVEKIMSELNHHIQDEEGRILPLLASKCSEAELMDLGKTFQSAVVTTHPHPMAPREGVAAQMAHAASIPLDKAKDAMQMSDAEKAAALKRP